MKTLHLGIITVLFSVSLLLVMPSVYAQDPTDTVDVKAGDTILYTFGSDKATDITFVNVQMGGTFTKAYFMLTADNRQYADDNIITHDDRVIRPDYTQKLADAGGTFTVKIHVSADADPDAVRHITIFGEEFVDAADCGGAANTCISNPVLQKLEINVKSADNIIVLVHVVSTISPFVQILITIRSKSF